METTAWWSGTGCGFSLCILSRLMQKQMSEPTRWRRERSGVVRNESAGGREGGGGGWGAGVRIRCSGSCCGAATAASGRCCSLWGWEPSCPPPTACPNTGCCSRAAGWAAEEQKERINHTASVLFKSWNGEVSRTEIQRWTFAETRDWFLTAAR